jgi:hypothetical protein
MRLLLRKLLARRLGSTGQSIVEFLVILPILLIMISGLIEFGFMLNTYLDVIDAARDVARFAANVDPLETGPTTSCSTPDFYQLMRCETAVVLFVPGWTDPAYRYRYQVALDAARDDVVISAFGAISSGVSARFPDADGISLYGWNNHVSELSTAEINAMLNPLAPNRGAVLVEIFYNYDMVLALPWITTFVPNPVTLHAYTIMPNTHIEPTSTPLP